MLGGDGHNCCFLRSGEGQRKRQVERDTGTPVLYHSDHINLQHPDSQVPPPVRAKQEGGPSDEKASVQDSDDCVCAGQLPLPPSIHRVPAQGVRSNIFQPLLSLNRCHLHDPLHGQRPSASELSGPDQTSVKGETSLWLDC